MIDLDELRRLLAEVVPGEAVVRHENAVRIKSARPVLCWDIVYDFSLRPELAAEARLFAAMRNALPALLAEAVAGRKLEAEVAEFLRAEVEPVPVGDGKEMVFRAPSLKMAMQMLKTERDIAIDAMRRSRDEYAERAHCFEQAAEAGRKLREARPRAEWHEDDGAVLWWTLPVDEPPYCGTPNDEDFPEYKTHWTPLVLPDDAAVAKGGAE